MAYRSTFSLTHEQALFIKDLRVTKDYSWRCVAHDVAVQYPELNVVSENQLDGMALCEAAMELLKEENDDAWF